MVGSAQSWCVTRVCIMCVCVNRVHSLTPGGLEPSTFGFEDQCSAIEPGGLICVMFHIKHNQHYILVTYLNHKQQTYKLFLKNYTIQTLIN